MHFKDKVAIVTRGSSGIGKETAKRLVAHGASVLIGGRDEAKLQSAAAEIGGTFSKVRVLAGGISSPATGAALVGSAEPPRSVGVPSAIDMHSKDARVNGETEQRLCAFSAWRETLQRRW